MSDDSWHLSKSVPITLIVGLITQGAAIVWTVSMMMSDIDKNAQELRKVEIRLTKVEDAVQEQAVSMARIDENIKAIRGFVERIANKE
jgi:archaellum component FlaC|tara:strand:- start:1290 stop:1553 length:264 start_codon:yes stop_codon:yes gene_type:complete